MNRMNVKERHKSARDLDINWLWNVIRSNYMRYAACRGTHAPKAVTSRILRFTVQGYLHKGYVYVYCNGLDLMDIVLTTKGGVVKKEINGIYIEDLRQIIHDNVEGT